MRASVALHSTSDTTVAMAGCVCGEEGKGGERASHWPRPLHLSPRLKREEAHDVGLEVVVGVRILGGGELGMWWRRRRGNMRDVAWGCGGGGELVMWWRRRGSGAREGTRCALSRERKQGARVSALGGGEAQHLFQMSALRGAPVAVQQA